MIPAPILARLSVSLCDGCLGAREEDTEPSRDAHSHHHFARKLRGPHNDRWEKVISAHKCNDHRDQKHFQRCSQPSHVPHSVSWRMRQNRQFVPNPKHTHTLTYTMRNADLEPRGSARLLQQTWNRPRGPVCLKTGCEQRRTVQRVQATHTWVWNWAQHFPGGWPWATSYADWVLWKRCYRPHTRYLI